MDAYTLGAESTTSKEAGTFSPKTVAKRVLVVDNDLKLMLGILGSSPDVRGDFEAAFSKFYHQWRTFVSGWEALPLDSAMRQVVEYEGRVRKWHSAFVKEGVKMTTSIGGEEPSTSRKEFPWRWAAVGLAALGIGIFAFRAPAAISRGVKEAITE